MENRFDLVVIGGGPGGYTAAAQAARRGLRTALVEARELGGTCLHRGCIPTKALLHVAETLRSVRQGEAFGVHAAGLTFDYGEATAYRRTTVEGLRRGVEQMLRFAGATVQYGRGRVCGAGRVCVTAADESETILDAKDILLATGAGPKALPIPGMQLPGVLDSDGLFALETLPEQLVIIGGGVIGVEMAEAFSSMGTAVTLLEAQPRLLPEMDREIAQNVRILLKKRGVALHTGAALREIVRDGAGLRCVGTENETECSLTTQYVLCAVGRRPATEGLFADGIRPEMTADGCIAVDERFATSLPGVYAIGDLIPGPQLAHVASAQGRAAADLLAGVAPTVDLSVIPQCVYTAPEIAVVGYSEEEAAAQGIAVRTGKALMGANGRAQIAGSTRGFVKVVAEAETGRILGAQLLCERATDMIGEFSAAIADHLTVTEMRRAIRPHPTFEESVGEALEAAE